jgi:hypothetical protein
MSKQIAIHIKYDIPVHDIGGSKARTVFECLISPENCNLLNDGSVTHKQFQRPCDTYIYKIPGNYIYLIIFFVDWLIYIIL